MTRHRTLLMPPCGSEAPRLFRELQPVIYELPACGMPLQTAPTKAVDEMRAIVDDRKARTRLADRS
jgi:hypothetical protein